MKSEIPAESMCSNPSIDATIRWALNLIDDDATTKHYVRGFKQQREQADRCMELFRELLVGAYLRQIGWPVRTSHNLDGQTPDWYSPSPSPAIVEVRSALPDVDTRRRLEAEANRFTWLDVDHNLVRLFQGLDEKAAKYRELVSTKGLGFVVASVLSFDSSLDREDIEPHCDQYFAGKPHLSGLLVGTSELSGYSFSFYANRLGTIPLSVPSGRLMR